MGNKTLDFYFISSVRVMYVVISRVFVYIYMHMLDTKILFFLEKGPYDYKVLSHAGTGGGAGGYCPSPHNIWLISKLTLSQPATREGKLCPSITTPTSFFIFRNHLVLTYIHSPYLGVFRVQMLHTNF